MNLVDLYGDVQVKNPYNYEDEFEECSSYIESQDIDRDQDQDHSMTKDIKFENIQAYGNIKVIKEYLVNDLNEQYDYFVQFEKNDLSFKAATE